MTLFFLYALDINNIVTSNNLGKSASFIKEALLP